MFEKHVFANRFFEKLLGVPLERAVGAGIERFVHPGDLNDLNAVLDPGGLTRSSVELRMVRGDGVSVPVYISANRIILEDVPVFCLTVTDLTDQKRHERLLEEERLSRGIVEQ